MRTIVFLLFLSLYPFLSPGQIKIDLEFLCGPQTTFFQVEGEQNGLKTGPYWRDVTFAGRLYLHNGGPTRAYVGLSTYEMDFHLGYEGYPRVSHLGNWVEGEVSLGLQRYWPLSQKLQVYVGGELGLAIIHEDWRSGNFYSFQQGFDEVVSSISRNFDPGSYLGLHLKLATGLQYQLPWGFALRSEAYYQQGTVPMDDAWYTYRLPGQAEQSGILRSRGSGLGFRLGLSYEISRLPKLLRSIKLRKAPQK